MQEGELGRLIRGHHPHTEEQLRTRTRRRGVITIERIDPLTDERRIETKKLAPVAGFDLVFSPPKSVSLLHALGDEETRRAVNEAHLTAWQAALAYLEDEACVTRRGAQRRASRARRRVRRRRLPAPHEPRAGPAPAHARDRREHGADARATASGARSTASRSSRATGSLPATSTRPSCAPSSPARSASSGRRRARAWPSSGTSRAR